jgi:hypothetical protein
MIESAPAVLTPEEQRSRFPGPHPGVPEACGGNSGDLDTRNGMWLCWRREIPPFTKRQRMGHHGMVSSRRSGKVVAGYVLGETTRQFIEATLPKKGEILAQEGPIDRLGSSVSEYWPCWS